MDFAVVCNGDIVLSSWQSASYLELERDKARIKELFPTNAKIVEFFSGAFLQGGRGRIRQIWKCPNPDFRFTDEDDLHIFVGDCHINLFKEWAPDNFAKNSKPWEKQRTRTSLIDDFEHFLDYASGHASKEKIIQVGDLYDYWEVQNLYEYAAEVLLSLMIQYGGGWHRKKGFSDNEFPASILTDPAKYLKIVDDEKQRLEDNEIGFWDDTFTFAYAGEERIESSHLLRYVHLRCLATYFGIDTASEPVRYNDTDKWRKWKENWLNGARKKFWEKKPTPRDVLALIYFGQPFADNRGMSPNAPPVSFPDAGWFGTYSDLPWTEANHAHFREMSTRLKSADKEIDFLNYQDLKGAIESEYGESLFQRFTTIEGNHDMDAPNLWLDQLFEQGNSIEDVKKALSKESLWEDRIDETFEFPPKITKKLGKKDGIYCEHGHAWDIYNNAKNYSLLELDNVIGFRKFGLLDIQGGYHACRGWTVSGSPVYDGDMNDASVGFGALPEWGKRRVDGAATKELILACETRMKAVFDNKPDKVRLIVMGHTHGPKIFDYQAHKEMLRAEQERRLEELKNSPD
jgi:hypothetical protein